MRNYDTIVVGGGVAGIAAALSSARAGAKTLLVEREYLLGGLATMGIVTGYLPICDGMGRQVSFGICEELLRMSIEYGLEGEAPVEWLEGRAPKDGKRYRADFNPSLFAILAGRKLRDANANILYGAQLDSCRVENRRIVSITVHTRNDEHELLAKNFVDATGDARLCELSGLECKLFEQKNIPAAWYYGLGNGTNKLNALGFCDKPEKYKEEKEDAFKDVRYLGLEGFEVSNVTENALQRIFDDVIKKRESDSKYVPTIIPTIPQVRMTRRLVGEITQDDTDEHKYYEDSVGMISDWRKRGPVYEVPFGTMYNAKVKNLLAAGRCTSVTEAMWDISRVIPPCAVTGEAAGTAAAMFDDFTKADIPSLQSALIRNGVKLHENEL